MAQCQEPALVGQDESSWSPGKSGSDAPSAESSTNTSAPAETAVKKWSLSTSRTAPPGLGDKCVVCGETKEDWPTLWKHMHSHDPVPPDPRYIQQSTVDSRYVECLVCGKRLRDLYHMRRHYASHATHRVFSCPLCPSSLKTTRSFIAHFVRAHANNVGAQYKCSECDRIFFSTQGLQVHKLKHSDGGGKERCEVCFKWLTARNLEGHYYTHTGEKRYTCSICGKGFMQKRRLRDHVKRTHLDIKVRTCQPRECKVCGKILRSPEAFQGHMRRHTEEPSDICCICARPFYTKTLYVAHMRRVHIGEKNVTCPVCGKGFYDSAYLQQHVKVHIQEKKFKCDVCGKAFTWKHKIQDHMKTHSEERPFRCGRCGEAFKWKHNLSFHVKRKHAQ